MLKKKTNLDRVKQCNQGKRDLSISGANVRQLALILVEQKSEDRLVVVGGDELMRWRHAGPHRERTGDVRDGRRDVQVRWGEVVVHRLGRLLLKRVQVVVTILIVKLVLIKAAQRLAILSWLVRATMSAD